MTKTARRRRLAIVATLISVSVSVSIGGAAVALWSAGGTGAGAAQSASPVALTLTSGAVSGDLYPGSTATVTTSVTNTNTASVRIVSLALDTTQGTGGFAITGDQPVGGCSPTSFAFTTQNVNTDLAAGASSALTLPGAISLSATAANACQGATVTIYLSAGT